MTNIESMKAEQGFLAAGTIPLNPDIRDYDDAKGKVVLFVRDEPEGRSMYMGLELYGEISRLWEVRYEDFATLANNMMIDIAMLDIAKEEGTP